MMDIRAQTKTKINTEDVVECKMDLSKGVGSLACRICSASYQMPIHHLHEPIDVFSEWLDDCEAAERGEVAAASNNRTSTTDMSRVVHDTSQDYGDEDSDDDELPEASGLGQKKHAAAVNSGGGSGEGGGAKDNDGGGDGGGGQKKTSTAALGLDESDSDSD